MKRRIECNGNSNNGVKWGEEGKDGWCLGKKRRVVIMEMWEMDVNEQRWMKRS